MPTPDPGTPPPVAPAATVAAVENGEEDVPLPMFPMFPILLFVAAETDAALGVLAEPVAGVNPPKSL